MFTGIIEATAQVNKISGSGQERYLTVMNPFNSEHIKHGDSIAVDGMCLTITEFTSEILVFFISSTSLEKTIAASYKKGSLLNLERALQFNGRLDGHIVTGHIDTVSKIKQVKKVREGIEIEINLSSTYEKLVVDRGSIAINGISLTISELKTNSFVISLIPETLNRTTFARQLKVGDYVNLEFDILGKYVLRQMADRNSNLKTLLEKL